MNEVGNDVIEQTLVMRDDNDRALGTAQGIDAVGNGLERVDIETESVSSRIASFGSSSAIWKISLRFFSPPEKPTLTARETIWLSIPNEAIFFLAVAMKSMASSSSSPRCLRAALTAARRK